MHPYPSEWQRQKVPGSCLQRFLFILTLLCLAAISVILLAIGQLWYSGKGSVQHPTSLAVRALSPTRSPLASPTSTVALNPRIDRYIAQLTQAQQIGQLLMLAVYTDGYTSALDQPLQQWDIANALIYNQYNGGALMPTTLSAWTQLVHDLHAHANHEIGRAHV